MRTHQSPDRSVLHGASKGKAQDEPRKAADALGNQAGLGRSSSRLSEDGGFSAPAPDHSAFDTVSGSTLTPMSPAGPSFSAAAPVQAKKGKKVEPEAEPSSLGMEEPRLLPASFNTQSASKISLRDPSPTPPQAPLLDQASVPQQERNFNRISSSSTNVSIYNGNSVATTLEPDSSTLIDKSSLYYDLNHDMRRINKRPRGLGKLHSRFSRDPDFLEPDFQEPDFQEPDFLPSAPLLDQEPAPRQGHSINRNLSNKVSLFDGSSVDTTPEPDPLPPAPLLDQASVPQQERNFNRISSSSTNVSIYNGNSVATSWKPDSSTLIDKSSLNLDMRRIRKRPRGLGR